VQTGDQAGTRHPQDVGLRLSGRRPL
jgi:hypothetical protein